MSALAAAPLRGGLHHRHRRPRRAAPRAFRADARRRGARERRPFRRRDQPRDAGASSPAARRARRCRSSTSTRSPTAGGCTSSPRGASSTSPPRPATRPSVMDLSFAAQALAVADDRAPASALAGPACTRSPHERRPGGRAAEAGLAGHRDRHADARRRSAICAVPLGGDRPPARPARGHAAAYALLRSWASSSAH